MKKLLAGVAAIALVGGIVATHATELSPLLGTMNADNVTFYPGLLTYPNGGFHAMGMIYGTSASVATGGGTTEQTLATYSLPANALDAAGRRIRVHTAFHMATNGNNKTIKLYFGGSSISSGTLTDSNKNGVATLDIVKSGASTQIVSGTMQHDTTMITPYVNASGSDTDTAAITIKMTGQDGTDSAGDIVMDDFYVEYMN